MKRYIRNFVALILCITFIFPLTVTSTETEENVEFFRIQISTGDGISAEKAVLKHGDIYIPAVSFSKYTRYDYDIDNHRFTIKGQDADKAFKKLKLDPETRLINISGKRNVKLSDCFTIDGQLYLPFCQLLPLLDAEIFSVQNGVIQVTNPTLTMADILYDFDINSIYFDYSAEFLNNPLLADFYVVPAYIFDTIVNFRYGRLDIISHSGDYNDYKEIFSELLAEDNLYLQTKAYNPSQLESIIDIYKNSDSDMQKLNTVFDWIDSAGKTADTSNGDILLDLFKDVYKDDEYKINNMRGINEAFYGGNVTLSECVSTISYIYTYMNMIDDNHEMLKAVYKTDSSIASGEIDRKAASHVCDLYGDNIEKAVFDEIIIKYSGNVVEELINPISVYVNTSKAVGLAFNSVLPYSYSDIARLPLYAEIITSAKTAFNQSEIFTDDGTNTKRLSLLLCLMASRKCFQIMSEAADNSSQPYYRSKINTLEILIQLLYLVGENTEFDSYEHFESHYKDNLKKISVTQFEVYNTELPKNSIGNLTEIGYFEKSNKAKSNISSVATTDGNYLFVVSENGIDRYGWNGTVEMTIPGKYDQILYSDGILYASGNGELYTLDIDGNNKSLCFTNDIGIKEFCLFDGMIYYLDWSTLYRYSPEIDVNIDLNIHGQGFLAVGNEKIAVYDIVGTCYSITRYDPYKAYLNQWNTTILNFGRIFVYGGAMIEAYEDVYYANFEGYKLISVDKNANIYDYSEIDKKIKDKIEGLYYDLIFKKDILCLLGDSQGTFNDTVCNEFGDKCYIEYGKQYLIYYDMNTKTVIGEKEINFTAYNICDIIGDYWFLDTPNGLEIVYFPSK